MYTLAEVPVKVFEFAQSVYELYKVTCKLLLYYNVPIIFRDQN